MAPRPRGFTLIELMVVVALVVLLAGILVPSLSRAREQSKTMVCASSIRQISQLIFAFASAHDGRGPGRAFSTNPTYSVVNPYSQDLGSIDWADILNYDLLQNGTGPQFVFGNIEAQTTPGFTMSPRTLRCPNFIEQPNSYGTRPFGYNYDAAGGLYYNQADGFDRWYGPWWGLYGRQADPKSIDAKRYSRYAYGALLARFKPNQFILVENERRNDWTVQSPQTLGNGSVVAQMGDGVNNDPANVMDPPQPAWSACDGQFSFRHPYFQKSNFCFFDGHIEMLRPGDDIDSTRRLSIGQ